MNPLRHRLEETPMGTVLLLGTDTALTGVFLDGHKARETLELDGPGGGPVLERAAAQLAAYFAGELRAFTLPLAPHGTPFQQAVWNAMGGIPFGRTMSYGELARGAGRPAAARAVGGACRRNPIPIVIPCHRVVGSDGRLTGFGGGLPRKAFLLEHEARVAWGGGPTPAMAGAPASEDPPGAAPPRP